MTGIPDQPFVAPLGRDPMVSTPARKWRWFRGYAGRDFLRGEGWAAHAAFIYRPDLMRRDEEGRLVLVALGLELLVRSWRWSFTGELRRPISLTWRSDADEIARRLAAQGDPG